MTILILVTAGCIGAVILLFTFLKNKRKYFKPLDEEEISVRNESFNKLISDNYEPVDFTDRLAFIETFKKWQSAHSKNFEKATIAQREKLSWHMDNSEFSEFKGIYDGKTGPSDEYELVIESCFTDFFPSVHDMDDFAIGALLTEIMVLKNITPEQSANYYVHEKKHFVNHEMMLGIIMLDLYRKK